MSIYVIAPLVFIGLGALTLGYLFSPWCYFNGRGPSAGFGGIALAFLSIIFIMVGLTALAALGFASALDS